MAGHCNYMAQSRYLKNENVKTKIQRRNNKKLSEFFVSTVIMLVLAETLTEKDCPFL